MMKATFFKKLGFSGELVTLVFYLFIILCGFVAGTRIWVTVDIPTVRIEEYLPGAFADTFILFFAPAAIAISAVVLLSLFVAGWLLMPVLSYIIGSAAGIAFCAIFGNEFEISGFLVSFTFSACFTCMIAVVAFILSHAHRFSRYISYSGASQAAYARFFVNVFIAVILMLLLAAAFAGIIHFQKLIN